jgi:hypothetical protein
MPADPPSPPPLPPSPPFAPGTAILTTAYFVVDEEYFQSSHVTDATASSAETAQLEASVKSTLVAQGLNAQTVSMKAMQIVPGMVQTVEWRVDVAYLGDPIAIDAMFLVIMGSSIFGLGGVHANSLWKEHTGLTTISHAPAR